MAAVPISSLTSAEAFDSRAACGPTAARRLLDHVRQAYAGARRIEIPQQVMSSTWSYGKLFAALGDWPDDGTALWQRQLTLGPAPEFCLRGVTSPALPSTLSDERVTYRQLT